MDAQFETQKIFQDITRY